MRCRISITLAAIVFLAVGCEDTPVEPQAADVVSDLSRLAATVDHTIDRFSISGSEFIECGLNEWVDYEADVMFQQRWTWDAGGGFHNGLAAAVVGTALTASGLSWTIHETWNFQGNFLFDSSGAFLGHERDVWKFVGKPPAPSFQWDFLSHWAENANGVVLVDYSVQNVRCLGRP